MKNHFIVFFCCVSSILFSCTDEQSCAMFNRNERMTAVAPATVQSGFSIQSDSLNPSEMISTKYTCEGENISPDLQWKWNIAVPENVKGYAVLVTSDEWYGVNLGINPRAVDQSHWVVFNIPTSVNMLHEGVIINGSNGAELRKYNGPRCTAITQSKTTKSKYAFTIYALDTTLDPIKIQTKDDLVVAIQNHIVARGTITKFYTPQQNTQVDTSR